MILPSDLMDCPAGTTPILMTFDHVQSQESEGYRGIGR